MWAIPTGASWLLKKKNQVKSPSPESRTPNSVRIRQSGRTGNRGVTSKAYRVFNKKTMVVEESVHVVFDESNESLERRESVNVDVGLDFSMGRLQIDDKVHQQEEEIDSKKEESPFAHPPPPQLE